MVDDPVRAGQAELMRHDKTMHHAGGVVDLPQCAVGAMRHRARVIAQRLKPAQRIDRAELEKVKERAGLIQKPEPVRGPFGEIGAGGSGPVADLICLHGIPLPRCFAQQ